MGIGEYGILTKKQIDDNSIDILNKIGKQCVGTDLIKSICFGDDPGRWFIIDEPNSLLMYIDEDGEEKYFVRRNGEANIRPIIKYPDFISIRNTVLNDDGIPEFEFGEYPQNRVDEELDNKLLHIVGTDLLKATGKVYRRMGSYDELFHEFEYEGKKYASDHMHFYEVTPIKWLVDDKNKILLSKYALSNLYLSKKHPNKLYDELNEYFSFAILNINDYKCVKKIKNTIKTAKNLGINSAILSKMDERCNNVFSRLIVYYLTGNSQVASKKLELLNIELSKMVRDYVDVNEKKIESIKKNGKIIDTLGGMPIGTHAMKKYPYLFSEEFNSNNRSKIEVIIDDIRLLIDDHEYGDRINKEIDDLIYNFNERMEKSRTEDTNSFLYEYPEQIVKETEQKLNLVLDNIKNYYSKGNITYDMICYLEKLLDIINKTNVVKDDLDDFQKDINKIVSISIPFLKEDKQEKYYGKLYNIVKSEKDQIEKYVESQINISMEDDFDYHLKYHSVEELIMYLRNCIQPLLEEIANEVIDRDLQKGVNESMMDIIDSNYKLSNNSMINLYTNQMSETYNQIISLLDSSTNIEQKQIELWKNEIQNILLKKIDFKRDINEVLNDMKIKWLSLNKIQYEIEDYINKQEYIDNNIIKY